MTVRPYEAAFMSKMRAMSPMEAFENVIDEMESGEQLRFFVFAKRVEEAYGERISASLVNYLAKHEAGQLNPRISLVESQPRIITRVPFEPEPEPPTQYDLQFGGYDNEDSRFPLLVAAEEGAHDLVLVNWTDKSGIGSYVAGMDLYADRIDLGYWEGDGEWVVVHTVRLDLR